MLYFFEFKLANKNFHILLFLLVFNFFYQIALGQDSIKFSLIQQVEKHKSNYELIGLSKEQIARIDSINTVFKKEEKALIKTKPGEGLGKKLDKLNKKWEKATKQVMTEEQYKAYENTLVEEILKPIPMR